MFAKIGHYGDARKYGVPVDGFVGTVISGKGDSAKIVGYSQGQTFSKESIGRISPHMKKFTLEPNGSSESFPVQAINGTIARSIGKDLINGKFRIFQHSNKVREI